MSGETDMLSFEGEDYYQLFDLLIEASSKDWSQYPYPRIKINGKIEGLHKAVRIISDKLGYEGELLPQHQEKMDRKFSKRQHGYGRTANNLAHRAHENWSPHLRSLRARAWTTTPGKA